MEEWEVGLPVGAGLDRGDLAVMREVMTDRSASGSLGAATAAWNDERITWAMQHWSGADADSAEVRSATYSSAALLGFVLQAQGAGLEAQAKSADETTKAYLGFASDVIGLIPTGGTFSSFLVDQATGVGKDAITDELTGRQARVEAENHSVQEVALTDLQIAIAVAAAEAGHIAPEGMVSEAGRRYPWFDAGGFDPDVLADPGVRNEFIHWVHSSEVGRTMTQVVPADSGFERGRAGIGEAGGQGAWCGCGRGCSVVVAGCAPAEVVPVPTSASAPFVCDGVPAQAAELVLGVPSEDFSVMRPGPVGRCGHLRLCGLGRARQGGRSDGLGERLPWADVAWGLRWPTPQEESSRRRRRRTGIWRCPVGRGGDVATGTVSRACWRSGRAGMST